MSAKRIVNIKPANGRVVICPETELPIISKGEQRELTPYWSRRKREGDVIISNIKPKAEANQ